MNIQLRCKICGAPLTGCVSCEGIILNWRNIACSELHFQEYIQKVEQERNKELKEGDKS